MVTEPNRVTPVARAVSTGLFCCVALGVAAVVWVVTAASWWQAVGSGSAPVAASVVALATVAGLVAIAALAEGGPTFSMAGYLAVFAVAATGFVGAVWTTIVLVAAVPLGVSTATTAAGALSLLATVGLVATAAVTIVVLGRSADWALCLRMAVAVLLLVLVTIGFLGAVWLFVALLSALLVGPVTGLYVAAGVTFAVAALIAYREFNQVRAIENSIDATPTTPDELPGIHAATTKVASQLGVPKPTVAISETYAPEAMVVGFRPSEIHLVLSYGAVRALSEAQLEAVIAHELAHVANRDAMVMTAVSTPVVLADGLRARVRPESFRNDAFEDEEWERPDEPEADDDWGSEDIFGPNDEWRMAPPSESADDRNGSDDDANLIDWFVTTTLFVIATVTWVSSRAIVAVLSRSRELSADRTAAELTGSPAALAGALRTLDDRIERTPNQDLREAAGVSSLSILPLESVAGETDEPSLIDRLRLRLFRTHPPTERRLAVLEELERELD
ncbi:M48 family metalloprotease [Natronolimnohabitans innermongolicus]|uniref:Heat shock protein HtpX n=1 Tax=Natronolimnohabitans innermongolicus JCM 12255 TaxID=1227499 RepID=L9X1X2_9EURY|nr:M48 family metalloprotease [Natronolimnohabitans innermongolicus]ELY55774.1 heat shock protein HtpX [Natronolimnohabitans innermongolicus JCM 12255]